MYKVLIADDHTIVATGVEAILNNQEDVSVIGLASNGEAVLNFIEKKSVDLVLMDINMPVMNGIDCTRKLKKKHPHIKVIILTMYNRAKYIQELVDAGADGVVLKNNTGKELRTAIARVRSNGQYFDSIHEFEEDKSKEKIIPLSPREIEIVILLSEGLLNNAIAKRLHISEHTVKTHRKNILRKSKVKSTEDLISYAMKEGII